MLVKFSYFCQLFSSYTALFGETPIARAHEALPDTLVQVSARSVHSYIYNIFIYGGDGLD